MGMMDRLAGPSAVPQIQKQITNLTSQAREALEQGKGLAALNAMGAILQGPNFMRALGGAGVAFADSYKGALAANQAAKTSIAQMNINLAAGQRAEKLGLVKDASASYRAAKKYRLDAFKAQQEAAAKGLIALSRAEKAAQPPRPYKPSAPLRDSEQMEYVRADEPTRALMDRRYQMKAPAVAAAGVAQGGANERLGQTLDLDAQKLELDRERARAAIVEKATKAVDDNIFLNPEYTKAMRGKDPQGRTAAQVRAALIEAEIKKAPPISAAPAAKTAAAAAPVGEPMPANATAASFKDGVVYATNRGPAKWNAATGKFTPITP